MINQILDEILENISWRLEEVRQYDSIINSLTSIDNESYDMQVSLLLRSAIPMVYAHWEGFVVSTLNKLFTYLNSLELGSIQYCHNYLTTAYEQSLQSLVDSKNFDKRKKHLINLYNNFSTQVKFNKKIDTKSNLTFSVLQEICLKVNLDDTKFNEYKIELDKLVNIRNSIAHGDVQSNIFTEFKDIEQYIDLLEALMLDFNNEIQLILEKQKYLKEKND